MQVPDIIGHYEVQPRVGMAGYLVGKGTDVGSRYLMRLHARRIPTDAQDCSQRLSGIFMSLTAPPNLRDDTPVGSKQMPPQFIQSAVDLLKETKHANALNVRDIVMGDTTLAVVYEPVPTGLLVKRVRQAVNQRLSDSDARLYIRQVAHALGYFHSRRIAHGDMTGDSFLVEGSSTVFVAGFGEYLLPAAMHPQHYPSMLSGDVPEDESLLSFAPPDAAVSANTPEADSGSPLQTPFDAFQEHEYVTRRSSDVWAVGALLYLMVKGRTYDFVDGECKLPAPAKVPTGNVDDLLARMLALNPSRRATAADVVAHPWMAGAVPSIDDEPLELEPVAVAASPQPPPSTPGLSEASGHSTIQYTGREREIVHALENVLGVNVMVSSGTSNSSGGGDASSGSRTSATPQTANHAGDGAGPTVFTCMHVAAQGLLHFTVTVAIAEGSLNLSTSTRPSLSISFARIRGSELQLHGIVEGMRRALRGIVRSRSTSVLPTSMRQSFLGIPPSPGSAPAIGAAPTP